MMLCIALLITIIILLSVILYILSDTHSKLDVLITVINSKFSTIFDSLGDINHAEDKVWSVVHSLYNKINHIKQ